MIRAQIGVWSAQNASKPSGNIINTPPKYPQTHLQTFFSGDFSPQIAQKRLSPLGRFLGISPTASACENRYFGHKSGSGAQNPDFFGSSVAESPGATFRLPENLAETASTGPQTRFLGIFGRCGVPEKTQVTRTPKTPQNAKKSKFRQNEAVSSKILFLGPPPMCSG